MARHTLGLAEARRGLGLTVPRELNTAAAGAAAVPRAAPVAASDRKPLDDVIARVRAGASRPRAAPAAQPRAGRAPGIPQFQTDPIAALGFVLREVGAGFQGKELPSQRIAKQATQQRAFELKRFQLGLSALGEFTKLSPKQRAAAAAGFNEKFGEITGFDFAELAVTVDLDDVVALAEGIDAEIIAPFSSDPETLQAMLQDPNKRALLEELSDARNLNPALQKIIAGAGAVSESIGEADKAALAKHRFTMLDIRKLAPQLDLTKSELAALDRKQATALPQLSEATGLRFTAAGVLQKEAELVSLDRVRAESKVKAEGKAAGTPPERTTNLVDFKSGKPVLKTSASSSVRGAVATLFGGTFDPITETIKGLDKDSSRRALAVQVEAERLLLEQTEVTPAAAVQSALKTIEARGAEGGGLPSPAQIPGMEVDEVRRLVESLSPETVISQELADAIKRKLKVK